MEEDSLTLGQLCRACGTHADWIISLVEESIIEPYEPHAVEINLWRFSGASLRRARSALRLQRDLGLNLAGIALTLDLMDELENLRAQLNKGHG
jgi:chaperone modulatory protein CbpM